MEREEDQYLAKMHVKLKKPRESFSQSIKKGKRKRTGKKKKRTKSQRREKKKKERDVYIYIYIEKNSDKMNYMKWSPRFSMDEKES